MWNWNRCWRFHEAILEILSKVECPEDFTLHFCAINWVESRINCMFDGDMHTLQIVKMFHFFLEALNGHKSRMVQLVWMLFSTDNWVDLCDKLG